ncbi:MAG: hypothetical protein L6V81_00825 [Clostridium sp.]|nr:MAG: hypothetical protein L6V81_00825 [Clostridium sp.]
MNLKEKVLYLDANYIEDINTVLILIIILIIVNTFLLIINNIFFKKTINIDDNILKKYDKEKNILNMENYIYQIIIYS